MTMTLAEPKIADETSGVPHLTRLADLFRLLSDRTRLSLLLILAGGERNVTSLCEELRLPQPTVSHHLGLLRTGGLLASRRAGKQIYYQLGGRAEVVDGCLMAFQIDGCTVSVAEDRGGTSQP